jgi:hypothetical protein
LVFQGLDSIELIRNNQKLLAEDNSLLSSKVILLTTNIYSWKRNKIYSRVSSVGIATGYWLSGQGSISGKEKGICLLHSVQPGSRVHPASYTMGIEGSFPGGCKAARP